jgi:hypothetical protein
MIQLLLVFAVILLIIMGIQRESYKESSRSYDIVLVIGQSNAVGFSNEAPMLPPNTASSTCVDALRDNVTINTSKFDPAQDLVNPNPNIWVLDRDPSWPVRYDRAEAYLYRRKRAEGGVLPAIEPLSYYSTSYNPRPSTNFSSQFAQRYVRDNTGKHVLIINNAFEDIPLSKAGPNNSHEFIKPSIQWNTCGALYNTAIRRVKDVLSWNTNNRVVAILWSQGEADIGGVNSTTVQQYITDLKKFVNKIRTDIGNQNIPFISCGYSTAWWSSFDGSRESLRLQYQSNLQSLSVTTFNGSPGPVRSGPVRSGPGTIQKFGYVSTDGVGVDTTDQRNNNNTVHFSFAGQRELGKRFYEVYKVIR